MPTAFSRLALPLVVVLAALLLALFAATWWLSRPAFDEALHGDPGRAWAVAPMDVAVTLARARTPTRPRTLLVTGSQDDAVLAIDLEEALGRPVGDAVSAFETLGFDGLARIAREASAVPIPASDLTLPFDPPDRHIAAGTNYRAHAEEVGIESGPFLFPKLSRATAWNADVPPRTRLDYEAEVCVVPLTRHMPSAPATLGYVLCNDYTDRWALVTGLDFDQPMGTTGFPDAKGGPGMLPIGPFLVIPRRQAGFHEALEFELYVNGRLRQREGADLLIWSPEEILARALDGCDEIYRTSGGDVSLTDCEGIPARTLVLTGTPAGVMFHVATIWYPGAYLGTGDEVWTTAPMLGALHNRIR